MTRIKISNYVSFFLWVGVVSLLLLTNTSCKKIKGFSTEPLSFSADTLVFDTVFTTIGSTTRQLKIYNTSNKPLKIDEIRLMGNESSPFRINVDGASSKIVSDLELAPKDSMFLFVNVKLSINGQNLPMVVEDSIRFTSNGNQQFVQLAVWGQDMYYHYSDLENGEYDLNNDVTWPNDKPHLIYGAAVVDSAKTLTIQADTKIYLHKNAFLFNFKGTLNIEGTKGHEVQFLGDRLESEFDELAGQYYGIYLHQPRPSTINYAIIKNAVTGIHVYSQDPTVAINEYALTVTNTVIENSLSYGIWNYAGSSVKAENCLIAKSGSHGFFVLGGGKFNLTHCDLLGYGDQEQAAAALAVTNYYNDNAANTTYVNTIDEGSITNCVVYGNLNSEIVLDTINPDNDPNLISLNFSYSLFKKQTIGTDAFYGAGMIWNTSPMFTDITENDFHFELGSPLDNAGIITSVLTDLEENPRSSNPDLGCYEKN